MKKLNIEVGDLVEVKNHKFKGGIVKADDTMWYVLDDHFDVNNRIVDRDNIVKIIKKQLIPAKWVKYL